MFVETVWTTSKTLNTLGLYSLMVSVATYTHSTLSSWDHRLLGGRHARACLDNYFALKLYRTLPVYIAILLRLFVVIICVVKGVIASGRFCH